MQAQEAIDIYAEQFKVIESFEYFLDEYVWIEDKITNAPLKLSLWPAQRSVLPKFMSSRLLAIIKAHQLGYTWIFVAAYTLWLSITRPMHQVVINSFNEDAGKEIIDRINFIMDRLPWFLIPEIGTKNTLAVEFLHSDSNGVRQPSKIQVIPATEKGGQGKTPNIMIFDESCFNRYVARAYNGSLPGITQAQGKIILISNAIKTAPGWSFTRALYVGSMTGLNDFERIFLPWQANPNRSMKEIPGKLDGKGQPMTEFKRSMLRSGGLHGGQMDEEDFQQRYPETEDEAISIIGGSYFGKALSRHDKDYLSIEGHQGLITKDKQGDIEFIPGVGPLTVWRYPYQTIDNWDKLVWTNRYCIGSDISEGLGQSFSVAYVYDRNLHEIVARLRSNRIDAYTWGNMLHLLARWYDNALIIPERTGAGITTCKRLQDLNANLYLEIIPAKAGMPVTKKIGWTETHQSKNELCGELKHWLQTVDVPAVYCPILIDECSTYILGESGRLDPEEGHFGDCVIAAGCTIMGDISIGVRPTTIEPEPTGWLKKHREGLL